MRQIVLDTETTGLETELGHRIIEIGALELLDRQLSGKQLHYYLNPERAIERNSPSISSESPSPSSERSSPEI